MNNREEVEAFWTRGDIHSRIHSAMTKANLIDNLRILVLELVFLIICI